MVRETLAGWAGTPPQVRPRRGPEEAPRKASSPVAPLGPRLSARALAASQGEEVPEPRGVQHKVCEAKLAHQKRMQKCRCRIRAANGARGPDAGSATSSSCGTARSSSRRRRATSTERGDTGLEAPPVRSCHAQRRVAPRRSTLLAPLAVKCCAPHLTSPRWCPGCTCIPHHLAMTHIALPHITATHKHHSRATPHMCRHTPLAHTRTIRVTPLRHVTLLTHLRATHTAPVTPTRAPSACRSTVQA